MKKSAAFLEGKTIVLKCVSESPVKWTFNERGIEGATYFPNTLYIPSATLLRNGDYKCYGTDSHRQAFISIATVYVGSKFVLFLVHQSSI